MPDISMCQNNTCPSRTECYRFTATPKPYRQSYMAFKPKEGEAKCDSFTPNGAEEGVVIRSSLES